MPLYRSDVNIEILKLNSVNVKTVNETPIACCVRVQRTFVMKNQLLVCPEPISPVFKCIDIV